MEKHLVEFMQRVDPEIYAEMKTTENFEETVEEIYGQTQDVWAGITNGPDDGDPNIEMIAYLFTMQNQAIERLIEEIEALRPSIRFITSVLLGNEEEYNADPA